MLKYFNHRKTFSGKSRHFWAIHNHSFGLDDSTLTLQSHRDFWCFIFLSSRNFQVTAKQLQEKDVSVLAIWESKQEQPPEKTESRWNLDSLSWIELEQELRHTHGGIIAAVAKKHYSLWIECLALFLVLPAYMELSIGYLKKTNLNC